MIQRIVGRVDGQEIIFYLKDENKGLWETIVPLDLDGAYVIDLMAEDEAGNSSYYATVLFTVDTDKLHVSFAFLKYRLQSVKHGLILQSVKRWTFHPVIRTYVITPQICGYKLERGHQCELQ